MSLCAFTVYTIFFSFFSFVVVVKVEVEKKKKNQKQRRLEWIGKDIIIGIEKSVSFVFLAIQARPTSRSTCAEPTLASSDRFESNHAGNSRTEKEVCFLEKKSEKNEKKSEKKNPQNFQCSAD